MSYLFLAVPNFCGSTLLHSLFETCPSVTPLTAPERTSKFFKGKKDFVEGNVCAWPGYYNLNGPHSMEANMEHVYSDPNNYDWPLIKMYWEENWANTNPYAEIKMQKTPADIFRIPQILPHFNDLKWIISVRNPYAYVESIMRKATFMMDPIRQLDQVCFHALRTLEIQLTNKELLKDDAYTMTYEDFVKRPEYHREQFGKLLPGLEKMNLDSELWIKGEKVTSIVDDSEEKVQKLIDNVPNILDMINEHFIPKEHLLNQWGYQIQHTK
jgi:hypothetical protein